ncbi:MAG: leishmanolysin-related zinc metalloendopeptidase, partial [Gemmatimonadota bacterium]
WTLGTVAGSYLAVAEVSGLSGAVAFFATATADVPSILVIREGNHQTAQFGTTVSIPPSVRVGDQYGNGVAQVPVVFAVLGGGGSITGAQGLTDGEGVAAVGSWVLGPAPGPNQLSASVEGAGLVTFDAVALTAPPAAMTKADGDSQSAYVGTPVLTPPMVRTTDAAGNPVPGVPVVFTVLSGGGSITQEATTTDSEGLAGVGSWTLGVVAGSNTLVASASGLPSLTFLATGIPGPPASMAVHEGDGQSALLNTAVHVRPSVLLRDVHQNPTPGVAVVFSVTGGGGFVTGGLATTDGQGVARVGSWALGPNPGVNRLTASSAGVTDVVFYAQGLAAGGFQIDLEFLTSLDPAYLAVFQDAAARWEEIIIGDIPDYGGSLPAGGCQPVLEEGGIDDVKIYVTVKPIDGSGGVLGRAGPCYYRTVDGVFPLTGIMELDEADVADLQTAGLLDDVIVHEMGHILGFGTLWNASSNDFLVGGGTADPYFNGAGAVAAFNAAGGAARTDPKVPVENTGGSGTRDAHWRESVHNTELMTGWIEGGGAANPLSAITIASLADMGYTVDMSAADPYVLPNPLASAPGEVPGVRFFIKELPAPTPLPASPVGGEPGH